MRDYYIRRRPTPPPWGVLKLFDLGGKVVDATMYMGQRDLRFGRDYTPYLLAYAALVTPEGSIPINFGWHWQPVPGGGWVEISAFTVKGLDD